MSNSMPDLWLGTFYVFNQSVFTAALQSHYHLILQNRKVML